MGSQEQSVIENLLEQPYWVIDFLPRQVPADSPGQFFAVEEYYRDSSRIKEFRLKIADTLLKLNCYYGIQAVRDDDSPAVHNPPPETLAEWVTDAQNRVLVLVEGEQCLMTLDRDDLCATVYHPSPDLLSLLAQLAAANGLFVWQP